MKIDYVENARLAEIFGVRAIAAIEGGMEEAARFNAAMAEHYANLVTMPSENSSLFIILYVAWQLNK